MQAFNRPNIASREQPGGAPRAFSPIQALFLARLQRLITKRQQSAALYSANDWRVRLLDKALYSTYRDSVELGVGDEARSLLSSLRQTHSS